MKLAEALLVRGDLQSDINQLKVRLKKNAQTKEGGAPAENPRKLIEKVNAAAEELRVLIRRINKTNANTELEPGQLLSEALCDREALKIRHSAYNELAEAATIHYGDSYRSEILLKLQSTVEVSDIRKEAHGIASAYRRLDHKIQAKNWQVDLLE